MAISEDAAALVAAQLTRAWAGRMGQATAEQQGKVGPNLVAAYRTFLAEVRDDDDPTGLDNWVSSFKRD